MKNIIQALASLSIILLCPTSCKLDIYELEREFKTPAGSIASLYPYYTSLSLDGSSLASFYGDTKFTLYIKRQSKTEVSFYLSDSKSSKTPLISDGQLISISATDINLDGKYCNVSFDEHTHLSVVDINGFQYYLEGRVSGHLDNPDLQVALTKTRPAAFDLEGEIIFEWRGSEGNHKLILSDIKYHRE